jgi:hypothetical protein
MDVNLLAALGGICVGLLFVILMVAFARIYALRRKVTTLAKRGDVAGLREIVTTSASALERSTAVGVLGQLGTDEAVEALAEALKGEKEPAVRLLLLETISATGGKAVGPLLRSWRELAAEERAGAVLTLKGLGQVPLLEALARVAGEQPELLAVLWDESDVVLRQSALEAMLSLGEPATPPLLELLTGGDRATRRNTADALVALYQTGKLGEDEKQRILAFRSMIVETHRDNLGHTDRGTRITWTGASDCVEPHTDEKWHEDRGIGVDFPV